VRIKKYLPGGARKRWREIARRKDILDGTQTVLSSLYQIRRIPTIVGPQTDVPPQKETCVEGKKEGQAVRCTGS
jgi:hypothetical protein